MKGVEEVAIAQLDEAGICDGIFFVVGCKLLEVWLVLDEPDDCCLFDVGEGDVDGL